MTDFVEGLGNKIKVDLWYDILIDIKLFRFMDNLK